MDLKLSTEQQLIVTTLKKNNVICDSVAGSGKTTTILHIADSFKNKNILLITYNARLKIETRQKVILYKISNLEVHSYHSFCVKYYSPMCFNDTSITHVINNNKEPLQQFSYDIIVIDEVQDMTPLYYELVCKICYNNVKIPKLCITGDKYQSIYNFNLADERYLTFADQLFKFNNLNWITLKLSISFRLPNTIANFINNCIINEERIKSVKKSEHKPRYIVCNTFIKKNSFIRNAYNNRYDDDTTVYEEVLYYLSLGYNPDDIFILAPTVKSNNCPAKILANKISLENKKIQIFMPTNDTDKIDKDNLKDKLVFLSFHQSKGLERKVCMVYGIDSSYFTVFKPDVIDTICPNEIYVALTRSTERLSIFHNNTCNFLPFLNNTVLKNYVELIGFIDVKESKSSTKRQLQISQLTDYTPSKIIELCMTNVKSNTIAINDFTKMYNLNDKTIKGDNKFISIPTSIKCNNTCENVEDIISLAIFEYYRYKKQNNNFILKELNSFINKNKTRIFKKINLFGIEEFVEKINTCDEIIFSDFLKLCNIYISLKKNSLFRINQISEYDWVSEKNLLECFNRLSLIDIDDKNIYKFEIKKINCLQKSIDDYNNNIRLFNTNKINSIISLLNYNNNNNNIIDEIDVKINTLELKLSGSIDKINSNYIMKIIFSKNIDFIHIIHVLIEKYIYELTKKKQIKCYIFNVLSNIIIELSCDNIPEIYNLLILNKFIGFKQLTYKTFTTDNLKIFDQFYN